MAYEIYLDVGVRAYQETALEMILLWAILVLLGAACLTFLSGMVASRRSTHAAVLTKRSSRQEVEGQLAMLRAVAIAQSEWRAIAEAVEEGAPLPIEGLTAEQEAAILALQFRRLAPRERERVAQDVAVLERISRDVE